MWPESGLGIRRGWNNDDFMRTESSSPRIVLYSTYYRTFSNAVTVRTVTGEYLIAMKLKSGRLYKFDRSDIIGILWGQEKKGDPLSLDRIRKAAEDLYGSYDVLSDEMKQFIERAVQNGKYEEIYESIRHTEAKNREILLEYQEEKPGGINEDNVNDIVEALRRKKKNQKSTVI